MLPFGTTCYTTWLSNYQWRFLAGKIHYQWVIFHVHVKLSEGELAKLSYPLALKHGSGKSWGNGGFDRNIIDTWSIFQNAMFDYHRVPMAWPMAEASAQKSILPSCWSVISFSAWACPSGKTSALASWFLSSNKTVTSKWSVSWCSYYLMCYSYYLVITDIIIWLIWVDLGGYTYY